MNPLTRRGPGRAVEVRPQERVDKNCPSRPARWSRSSAAWSGELSATFITALGAITLGAAVARLTPSRWVLASVISMCALYVALLAAGLAALLAATSLVLALPTPCGPPPFQRP